MVARWKLWTFLSPPAAIGGFDQWKAENGCHGRSAARSVRQPDLQAHWLTDSVANTVGYP